VLVAHTNAEVGDGDAERGSHQLGAPVRDHHEPIRDPGDVERREVAGTGESPQPPQRRLQRDEVQAVHLCHRRVPEFHERMEELVIALGQTQRNTPRLDGQSFAPSSHIRPSDILAYSHQDHVRSRSSRPDLRRSLLP